MIERKHVEAIREKFNRCGFCDCGECEEFTDALDAAISAALAAADEPEAVCEFRITRNGRAVFGCVEDDGKFRWDRINVGMMQRCPHCGRKIVEANAASGGGEKEAGDA